MCGAVKTPGVAFDCSGLTQAAFQAAGIDLPRVAQAQFDAGPRLPVEAGLRPGDLVFFGGGPSHVTQIGHCPPGAAYHVDRHVEKRRLP